MTYVHTKAHAIDKMRLYDFALKASVERLFLDNAYFYNDAIIFFEKNNSITSVFLDSIFICLLFFFLSLFSCYIHHVVVFFLFCFSFMHLNFLSTVWNGDYRNSDCGKCTFYNVFW